MPGLFAVAADIGASLFGIGEATADVAAVATAADVGATAADVGLGLGATEATAAGLGEAGVGLGTAGVGATEAGLGLGATTGALGTDALGLFGGVEGLGSGAGALGATAGEVATPGLTLASSGLPSVGAGALESGGVAGTLAAPTGAGAIDLTSAAAASPTGIGEIFGDATGAEITDLGTGQVTGITFPGSSAAGSGSGLPTTFGGITGDVGPSAGFPGATTASTPGSLDTLAATGSTSGAPLDLSSGASSAAGKAAPSMFDKLTTGAIDSVTKNPLGIGIAGLGLGMNLLKGNQKPAGTDQLTGQANQLSAQGQQLQSYLASGTLPPGVQEGIDRAKVAARARIISNFASQGMSTNPAENSALATELNNLDLQAADQGSKIATQLLQTGINETGLSSQIYENLVKIDQTQMQQTGQAIANFAAALGGSHGINLKLA